MFIKCKLILLTILVFSVNIYSQEAAPLNGPWTLLINKDSVYAYFIYYTHADNHNHGIVLKLVNKNKFSINYRFDLIFLSDTLSHSEKVEGILKPNEIKTGSTEGLFWIPFRNGKSISDVGIKNFKITRGNKSIKYF